MLRLPTQLRNHGRKDHCGAIHADPDQKIDPKKERRLTRMRRVTLSRNYTASVGRGRYGLYCDRNYKFFYPADLKIEET
jgi:hypothetical protein